ncbi:MAG: hypothetical protein HY894_06495 [Deltaproteobacteria bacterium]|nr:hypothetical protein [Deltaproteobacteria bacterium]
MPTYIVKDSPILHNGKRYEEGAEIELKGEEARTLKHLLEKKPETKNTNANGGK